MNGMCNEMTHQSAHSVWSQTRPNLTRRLRLLTLAWPMYEGEARLLRSGSLDPIIDDAGINNSLCLPDIDLPARLCPWVMVRSSPGQQDQANWSCLNDCPSGKDEDLKGAEGREALSGPTIRETTASSVFRVEGKEVDRNPSLPIADRLPCFRPALGRSQQDDGAVRESR
jgi:hypothetical protein